MFFLHFKAETGSKTCICSRLLMLRDEAKMLFLMQDIKDRIYVRFSGSCALLSRFSPPQSLCWSLHGGSLDCRAETAGNKDQYFRLDSAELIKQLKSQINSDFLHHHHHHHHPVRGSLRAVCPFEQSPRRSMRLPLASRLMQSHFHINDQHSVFKRCVFICRKKERKRKIR